MEGYLSTNSANSNAESIANLVGWLDIDVYRSVLTKFARNIVTDIELTIQVKGDLAHPPMNPLQSIH